MLDSQPKIFIEFDKIEQPQKILKFPTKVAVFYIFPVCNLIKVFHELISCSSFNNFLTD